MYPNINAELSRKGLSRIQLAERLNVSYSTIKNWMKGETEIPCSKIIKMAQLFHCSVDYLLGLDAGQNSA